MCACVLKLITDPMNASSCVKLVLMTMSGTSAQRPATDERSLGHRTGLEGSPSAPERGSCLGATDFAAYNFCFT